MNISTRHQRRRTSQRAAEQAKMKKVAVLAVILLFVLWFQFGRGGSEDDSSPTSAPSISQGVAAPSRNLPTYDPTRLTQQQIRDLQAPPRQFPGIEDPGDIHNPFSDPDVGASR